MQRRWKERNISQSLSLVRKSLAGEVVVTPPAGWIKNRNTTVCGKWIWNIYTRFNWHPNFSLSKSSIEMFVFMDVHMSSQTLMSAKITVLCSRKYGTHPFCCWNMSFWCDDNGWKDVQVLTQIILQLKGHKVTLQQPTCVDPSVTHEHMPAYSAS